MTIGEVYSNFIESKILAGCSENTLTDYRNHLLMFLRYVGTVTECSDITRDLINGYILSVMDSDLAKGTKSTYVRNVRIFLTYMNRSCPLPFDPRDIKVPKNPKKQVTIYSRDQVIKIFSVNPWSVPWITMRNRAIMALMYDSGLRLNECCTLLLRNVQFDIRRIKVFGKGDKERFVTYGDSTAYFIRQYINSCPHEITDTLFVKDHSGAMSTLTIKNFMADIKPYLPFDISAHKLRHNFATNWLIDEFNRTGQFDLMMLQYKMGHESSETTKMYLHIAMGEIASRSGASHLDHLGLIPGIEKIK